MQNLSLVQQVYTNYHRYFIFFVESLILLPIFLISALSQMYTNDDDDCVLLSYYYDYYNNGVTLKFVVASPYKKMKVLQFISNHLLGSKFQN